MNELSAALSSIAILLAGLCIVLGVYYLIWLLWLYIVPAVWAGAPTELANIGYWTFVGTIVLVQIIFNIVS